MREDFSSVSEDLKRIDILAEQFAENNHGAWSHLKNQEDYGKIFKYDSLTRAPLETLYGHGRDFAVSMANTLSSYNRVDEHPTYSSFVLYLEKWIQNHLEEFREVIPAAKSVEKDISDWPWAIEEMIRLHESQIRMAESLLPWIENAKKSKLYNNDLNKAVLPNQAKLRVLVSAHGIRTGIDQEWQRGLEDRLLKSEAKTGKLFIYESRYYGFLSAVNFLIPSVRKRKIEWFREEYTRTMSRNEDALLSIVAHSFGTYIVAEAMRKYDHIRFERIVFCGGIVETSYPWEDVHGRGQFHELLNQFGGSDFWARIAQWLVTDAGPSGRYGFKLGNEAKDYVFQESYPGWNHGAYFFAENYDRWLGFFADGKLAKNKPIRTSEPNHRPMIVVFMLIVICILFYHFIPRKTPPQPPGPTPVPTATPLPGPSSTPTPTLLTVTIKDQSGQVAVISVPPDCAISLVPSWNIGDKQILTIEMPDAKEKGAVPFILTFTLHASAC